MADLSDADIEAALAHGRAVRSVEPRAVSARYDGAGDLVVVTLTNGCSVAFPPRLVPGLEYAPPAAIAAIEVLGAGYGLHWEALDIDLSIPGLLSNLLGTQIHLARRAGRSTSTAKATATRTNGAKRGRPRKNAGSSP